MRLKRYLNCRANIIKLIYIRNCHGKNFMLVLWFERTLILVDKETACGNIKSFIIQFLLYVCLRVLYYTI